MFGVQEETRFFRRDSCQRRGTFPSAATYHQRVRAILVPVLALALGVYAALGLGYHRVTKACWETRHASGAEGEVYGGAVGILLDMAMWPVFLGSIAVTGISCDPS